MACQTPGGGDGVERDVVVGVGAGGADEAGVIE